jgi:hypothetical protein
MRVKNAGPTAINLPGAAQRPVVGLMPGAVIDLSEEGVDENCNPVQYYLAVGWLVPVSDGE